MRIGFAVAAGALLFAVSAASGASAADGWIASPVQCTPVPPAVMCGLDNPRGLAFGPQGALYVAEAGRGGFDVDNPFCFTGQLGAARCYGPTGAVSRLWRGAQERVATGLPSQARASDGGNAIGPHDIAMLGVGTAHVTIGLQQSPALRDAHPELSDLARLIQIEPNGEWRFVADLGAFEAANNPDRGPLDTNPYGLLAVPGGDVLTDAGGNSLLRVAANHDISTLAVFQSRGTQPPRSTDSVPTSIAIGPDGAYYVAELSGFPAVAGAANIYRVDPAEAVPGHPPPLFRADKACLGGFTTIIDIAFDEQGNLYVLQYGLGTLVRIERAEDEPGGICTQYEDGTHTVVRDGLSQPTSVAVGPDGALYVSNHGSSAGNGEVLRIEP
jgi:hypothetical protein